MGKYYDRNMSELDVSNEGIVRSIRNTTNSTKAVSAGIIAMWKLNSFQKLGKRVVDIKNSIGNDKLNEDFVAPMSLGRLGIDNRVPESGDDLVDAANEVVELYKTVIIEYQTSVSDAVAKTQSSSTMGEDLDKFIACNEAIDFKILRSITNKQIKVGSATKLGSELFPGGYVLYNRAPNTWKPLSPTDDDYVGNAASEVYDFAHVSKTKLTEKPEISGLTKSNVMEILDGLDDVIQDALLSKNRLTFKSYSMLLSKESKATRLFFDKGRKVLVLADHLTASYVSPCSKVRSYTIDMIDSILDTLEAATKKQKADAEDPEE